MEISWFMLLPFMAMGATEWPAASLTKHYVSHVKNSEFLEGFRDRPMEIGIGPIRNSDNRQYVLDLFSNFPDNRSHVLERSSRQPESTLQRHAATTLLS